MNPIARIEQACARFVEEAFARIFPSALDPAQVGRKLVAAMQATPAELFVVRVHPADYARFTQDRDLLEARWSALLREAQPSGRLDRTPRALLHEDARVVAGSVAIEPIADDRRADDRRPDDRRADDRRADDRRADDRRGDDPPPIPQRRPALALERADGTRVAVRAGLRIGRAGDNDVVLRDGRASRYHARIVAAAGAAAIEDVGSSNGTYVDGRQAQSAPLVPGATITIGETHLRVVAGDG